MYNTHSTNAAHMAALCIMPVVDCYQLAELQHEKEITDLELIQQKQEVSKKEAGVQKLEADKQFLTGQVESLNKDIQELKQKLQKQSEGTCLT